MPPKRKSARPAQPPQSDYDTDSAAITTSSMAATPARTNTELNLLVLRRYEPTVERIISIAPFAVVYLFSPDNQQWEKSGTEGTLFVCQLAAEESQDGRKGRARYSVVILNRKSMDNFAAELISGEDIEITEQYVILQVTGEDGVPIIYGLWIFSSDTNEGTELTSAREVVAAAIQECAIRAEEGRRRAEIDGDGYNGHISAPSYNLDGGADEVEEESAAPTYPPAAAGQPIDLMTLFGRPQAAPEPQPQVAAPQNIAQPMQHHAAPQQQPRFASTADTDFFRSASGPAAPPQQHPQAPPQQNALLDLFKSAKKT